MKIMVYMDRYIFGLIEVNKNGSITKVGKPFIVSINI